MAKRGIARNSRKRIAKNSLKTKCLEIPKSICLSIAIIINEEESVDLKQLGFGLFMLVMALFAIYFKIGWLGLLVIALVDIFMIFLIIATAIRSTKSTKMKLDGEEVWPYLPTRPGALILLPTLLSALIVAFGSVYLWAGQIRFDQPGVLVDQWDALYLSTVTMTTLGGAGVHAAKGLARMTVICEIFSGITMLAIAFPLLVGRLTMWDHKKSDVSKTVTVDVRCCPVALIFGLFLGVAVCAVAAVITRGG